jgi:Tol biopolymer transport system component
MTAIVRLTSALLLAVLVSAPPVHASALLPPPSLADPVADPARPTAQRAPSNVPTSNAPPDTTWTPFAPGTISLSGITDTSPSITADGETMVFARTENWTDKVPYIATRTGDGWTVRKAPFADTLYNLAITPDGQSIFFKKNEIQDGEEVSRAYRVDRTADGWGTPQTLTALFNIHAGYFCPMADGSVYFFARSPKPGIYRTDPDGSGGYTEPEWVSDAVSPDSTTSFDVLVHPDEDRLVITRAGIPDSQADELGPRGFFAYERTTGGWHETQRLDLPYGWGATVLPDGRFLFVDAGDLQTVPLRTLGLDWKHSGQR